MKKPIKLTITIVLALLAIYAFAWVYQISQDSFSTQAFNAWVESLLVSGTPNWKTYQSSDGEISFESPFPIKLEERHHPIKGKVGQMIFGFSQFNRSGFHLLVTSFNPLKTSPSIYIKEMMDATTTPYRKEANFQSKNQPTTCSGMPGTLVNYSFGSNGNPTHITELIVAKKNQFLRVETITHQNNLDSYNEWTKRIIDSIKIESKNK